MKEYISEIYTEAHTVSCDLTFVTKKQVVVYNAVKLTVQLVYLRYTLD